LLADAAHPRFGLVELGERVPRVFPRRVQPELGLLRVERGALRVELRVPEVAHRVRRYFDFNKDA
jgi:hypothetical protein